jgi:putative hydrolase of the HAD superfamily
MFGTFISSCEVGMRKPDPGIYNLAWALPMLLPSSAYILTIDQCLLMRTKLGIKVIIIKVFLQQRRFLRLKF